MKPLPIKLDDEKSERVRQSHQGAIEELQAGPLAGARVVRDVELEDGVPRTIAHKLGKAPSWVGVSVLRGATAAGYIVETRGGAIKPAQTLVLTANGYGATITVDLLVVP